MYKLKHDWVLIVTRVKVLTETVRFMWFFLWLMDECLVSTWL